MRRAPIKQTLAWWLEAVLVRALWTLFKAMPIDTASAVGGFIARILGPLLPQSNRARRNLARILPELTQVQREAVVRGMWDNLGRVAAEFPHLPEIGFGPGERAEVEGTEIALAARDDGQPALFVSAHIGNWEICGHCAGHYGIPLHVLYRAANNPKVEWVYRTARGTKDAELIPKGGTGARRMLELMKRGEHIGLLIDQKLNDGIPIPFMGIPAMTGPALAALALRFRCPVIPTCVVRTRGAHFRVVVEPPLPLPDSGDREQDMRLLMTEVNRRVEAWVRAHPEQWLWLHNRWPEP